MIRYITWIFLWLITLIVLISYGLVFSGFLSFRNIVESIPGGIALTSLLGIPLTDSSPSSLSAVMSDHIRNRQRASLSGYVTISLSHHNQATASLEYNIQGNFGGLWQEYHQLKLYHEYQGQRKEIALITHPEQQSRETTLSYMHDTMHIGNNEYSLELFSGSILITNYQFTLSNHVKEMRIGDDTIFLDPDYVVDEKSLFRRITSFDGHSMLLVTLGCEEVGSLPVVVSNGLSYQTIDGCFLIDEQNKKFLRFEKRKQSKYLYAYDIKDGEGNTLVYDFPLFRYIYGQWYQNFVMIEGDGKYVSTYEIDPGKFGDNLQYKRYDLQTQGFLLDVLQNSEGQVTITTPTERTIVYLYKPNSFIDSPVYPGLRYQYFQNNHERFRLIDQGDVIEYTGTLARQSIKLPVRNLTMRIIGTGIYLSDGISLVHFDSDRIHHPISVTPIQHEGLLNCNDIVGGFLDKNPLVFWLQGIGGHTTQLKHLGSDDIVPMFQVANYASANLTYNQLQSGENTLELSVLDDHGIIQCRKTFSYQKK